MERLQRNEHATNPKVFVHPAVARVKKLLAPGDCTPPMTTMDKYQPKTGSFALRAELVT
jgi:hypothetical protein